MNINEIPDPPIKPTKVPKIVVDRDREMYFSNPQLNASAPPVASNNPSSAPTKGGIWNQVNEYLKSQEKNIATKNEPNSVGVDSDKVRKIFKGNKQKSKINAWIVMGVIAWVGFSIVGGLVDTVSEFGDESSNNSSSNNAVTTNTVDGVVYKTNRTSCLSIEAPNDALLISDDNNPCEIDFGYGYTSTSTAYLSFDDENDYQYMNLDDLIDANSYVVLEEISAGSVEGRKVTGSSFSSKYDAYVFWVRDLNFPDNEGYLVETVTLFINNDRLGSTDEITDYILNSLRFSNEYL